MTKKSMLFSAFSLLMFFSSPSVLADKERLKANMNLCELNSKLAFNVMELRLEDNSKEEIKRKIDPNNILAEGHFLNSLIEMSYDTNTDIDTKRMSKEHKEAFSQLSRFEFLSKCYEIILQEETK